MLDQPRIYVACLSSYVSGHLHGAWIDAEADAEAMETKVQAMLKRAPVSDAEEYAIHDYEGLPTSLGEYTGLKHIAAVMEFIDDNSDHDEEVCIAALDNEQGNIDYAQSMLDRYIGTYESFRDYADEFAEQMMPNGGSESDQFLINYFDYESHARDLAHSHTVIELGLCSYAIFCAG